MESLFHAPRIAPKLFGSHGQRPWLKIELAEYEYEYEYD